MRKPTFILTGLLACVVCGNASAVSVVKKAAPVTPQTNAPVDAVAGLAPTVLNLVGTVQNLNAKIKDLDAECRPSSAEINFVDNTMKEWAKTGNKSADEMISALGRVRCASANGYAASVQISAGTEQKICVNYFGESTDRGTIWENYPRVGIATYCPDGSLSCAERNKKTVSDIYDIFNLIDFSDSDYTRAEATMAIRLLTKVEKCSNSKLSATKKAMWGEVLADFMGGVGQPTNTSQIMQTIQQNGLSNGGVMQSLGSVVTQFIDR